MTKTYLIDEEVLRQVLDALEDKSRWSKECSLAMEALRTTLSSPPAEPQRDAERYKSARSQYVASQRINGFEAQPEDFDKFCDACIPAIDNEPVDDSPEANPETILALIALVREMGEALELYAGYEDEYIDILLTKYKEMTK